MAVYGIDFYGVGRFGMDPATVRPDFSVAPFISNALDYATLHLQWTNPPSADCAYLRLIRNPRNLPMDEDDGVQVFNTSIWMDTVPDAPATVFGDPANAIVTGATTQLTDPFMPSGFQYYSMFGWSTSEQMWIRCTDLIALVPINWGYGARLYNLLPMAYRDADVVLVDPYNPWPVDGANPPLQRFLQLIGFQFDFLRTELESLMSINDAYHCSGALLPVMAQQFGLVHEPEMGMQQERQLVANAVHLYKLKGSPQGITEFVTTLTSYPNTQIVHHGYNELLVMDDGVMADAIGTWQNWPPAHSNFPSIGGAATGQTFTWVPNLFSVAGMTNPLETYAAGTFPTLQPPYGGADGNTPTGMVIQATGAGDLYATTGAMPITDFMSQYYGAGTATFRIQVWSSVSRQVWLSLWGDNGSGTPVQIVAPVAFTETANHWTMMTISGPVNPYPAPPAAAPPGSPLPTVPTGTASYYRIYPRIRVAGAAANEHHYITLVGMWPCPPAKIGVDTPVYDYPRDVKILVQPTASNLLPNTLTSFSRPNPNPPPNNLLIGFDGLTTAADPTQATLNPTGTLVYRAYAIEDPPALVPINGNAALGVDAGPGTTVWFGTVTSWSAPPAVPLGWFATTHQWFFGATVGPQPRGWFDPVYSWFSMNQTYFGVGSSWVNGIWFAPPQQPAMNGNLEPFQVLAEQPFNFSVYAQWLQINDPSNAAMVLGFRWYYPDGTYVEVTTSPQQITDQYQRFSITPAGGVFSLGEPPTEANTGLYPTTMYPFVRFLFAQQARFLLNSAMLSPATSGDTLPPPYMDATSQSQSTGDFIADPVTNASYVYPRRTPRIARLNAELYRWIPMGETYTITYASGAVTPPLDPTLW